MEKEEAVIDEIMKKTYKIGSIVYKFDPKIFQSDFEKEMKQNHYSVTSNNTQLNEE
jgi:hypothetical protein